MTRVPRSALSRPCGCLLLIVGIVLGLSLVRTWGEESTPPPAPSRTRDSTSPRSGRTRRPQESIRIISLPQARLTGSISVEQALADQAQSSPMLPIALTSTQLSQLAWAAQIQTDPAAVAQVMDRRNTQMVDPRRAMQLHFVLDTGIYLYQPTGHELQQTSPQDQRQELVLLTVDPSAAGAVGGAIVVSGPSRGPNARTTGQLKRTVLLETGRMVQNIRLQAAAQQLVTASVENIESERVGELLGLSRSLEVQYILFVGPRNTALAPMTGTPTSAPVRAKRVVLVVSPVGFSDTEFLEIQRVLSLAGVETVVASTNRGPITAASGQVAESQIELENVTLGQIDALVYIGGPGIAVLATNKTALELAQGALRLNKLVGATGTAPTLLAQAGLLNGVRVATAASEQNTLQAAGAQVTGNAVERDRQILTARGPDATTAFTRTLVNALVGR